MRKHLLTIQLFVTFVSLIIVAVGCTAEPIQPSSKSINTNIASLLSGTPVSYESISKSYKLGGDISEPTLLIADDQDSLDILTANISAIDQAQIKNINLENHIALAVFWGIKPSGGFSLTINNIFLNDDEITIQLLLQDSDPTFPKIEAATLPYHMIIIDQNILPDKKSTFYYYLIAEDEVLTTGKTQ